jgi:uncharacterized membrane protein
MNQKWVHRIILVLIVMNIILSGMSYISSRSDSVLCVIKSDCSAVQNSSFGQIFGIKVSLIGTVAFILLLLIYSFALRYRELYFFFVIVNGLGSVFSIWFIYLQFFILDKICSSCMFVDGFMIIIFLLSIFEFVKYKKDYKSILSYFK